MRYFIFLLLPCFLLLAPSCADDDLQPRRNETDLEALNRLVPITQTGAGTFGCLVNGELWIPEVDGASDVAADALLSNDRTFIELTLRKEPISDNRNQSIVIGCRFESAGSKAPLTSYSFFLDRGLENPCQLVEIDTSQTNHLAVDFIDNNAKIISGTFRCIFREPECPNTTIEITEGRFDLRYRF